jgi:osmotically-inducible protein OsmY
MFKRITLEKKVYLSFMMVILGLNLSAFAHADYNNQDQNSWNSSYNSNMSNPNGYRNNSYSNDMNANSEYMNNSNSTYSADANDGYRNNVNNSNISDQDLTKKIQDKIGPGWFSKGYDQVSFQVNDGIVTLQGSVKTASDKGKVEREVRNINGVRGLNSQIAVQDSSSRDNSNSRDNQQKEFPHDKAATSADDQLNKKIRDNTSRGWIWNSNRHVSLNTSNGVVTLEGTVNSANDQQKLLNEVQKIEGVNEVRSNLNINNR